MYAGMSVIGNARAFQARYLGSNPGIRSKQLRDECWPQSWLITKTAHVRFVLPPPFSMVYECKAGEQLDCDSSDRGFDTRHTPQPSTGDVA